jgi:hypothetical protein
MTAVRVALLVLLLAGALFAGYGAAFNWLAAGGPPTPQPYRDMYEQRGNVFASAAVVQLAAIVVVLRARKSTRH